jgi:hypothetical protein
LTGEERGGYDRRMRIFAFVGLLLVAACGSSTVTNDLGTGSPDLSASSPADLFFASSCGHPGDKGNSKGIGQFCMDSNDCPSGLLCSSLFHPGTFFCTVATTCSPPVDTSTCGENTVCQCDPTLGACGCTPTACAATPQG